MPDPLLYGKAIGIAAIISAIIVLIACVAQRRATAAEMRSVSAIAIGLGLASGYHVLSLQLAWPPANGLDRLLTIVIPATLVIEWIAGFRSTPRSIAWLLRMVMALAIPRILLHGSVYLSGAGDWTVWQIGVAMALCVALLVGLWGLLSRLSQRNPGVSIVVSICLAIQCAGATVMMAGYIKGGSAAFPLAATLLATATTAPLLANRSRGVEKFGSPVTLGVGVVGLFGILFIGHFFGRISAVSGIVMLLAPLLCWVSEIRLLRRQNPWVVGSIRLTLVAVPLLVVIALAYRDFHRDMSPLLGQLSNRLELSAND